MEDTTSNEAFSLTLEDILIFLTGSNAIPAMGLNPKPVIEFTEVSISPMSSTCSNTLMLPLGIADSAHFKYNMGFGIINSPGFL